MTTKGSVDIMEELERIHSRLGSMNTRLGRLEKRQDSADQAITEIREDRLNQRELLGAIAQGLDRIHERLGPLTQAYNDLPLILGRLEAKVDSVSRKLDDRPCIAGPGCNITGVID